LLDELTQLIVQKVDGKEALGFDVGIDLGDTGRILISAGSKPIAVSNEAGTPDTTFVMEANDLKSMLAGELQPMNAYMQGKLKVEGDLAKAMQVSSIFN
jgi:putative sterol carrier protein